MPEQPELDAAAGHLRQVLEGRTITRADALAISVLRTATPLETLVGRQVTGVRRRGKHLLIAADGPTMVVHLALAGWLRHHATAPASRPGPRKGPLALRILADDDSALDITEQGTRKNVAVWVTDHPERLETLTRLGPEVRDLSETDLADVLAATGSHLKTVLTDQQRMAGIGNAFSDEVLHRARLSPFTAADSLATATVHTLHTAMVSVLTQATTALEPVPLQRVKSAKKSLLRIHGRTGESCPVCGDTVAEVSYVQRSLQYCPTCQTGGRRLSDRRMDRLLR